MNVDEQTVVVMAGAREAHGIVTGLLARKRRVIASLPEPERMFGDLPVPTRMGLFEDVADASDWLVQHQTRAVLDASHAFDDEVCALMQAAAQSLGLPYLRVLRPPWVQSPGDCWIEVSSVADAAGQLPETAIAFTNTGYASLGAFEGFRGRKLLVRQTTPAQRHAPFGFIEFVEGAPPFSQFQEERLFRALKVSHLVCRNVGGPASMSKLLAARALSIPVMMIDRAPSPASQERVETVAEALAWEANL